MSTRPKVSVILLNLNGYELTAACLHSLRQITYDHIEILVVDQASQDGSGHRLKRDFPGVRVLLSPVNSGFAGGNNMAMQVATGTYFLLLNNDTVVTPGFLEPLVEYAERHPEVGALSPMIRYHSEPEVIQFAGGPRRIDLLAGRNSWRGWKEKDQGQFAGPAETTLAHGAAFLVHRSVVEAVGPLDHRFFLYYEEIDWCLRIRRAGYVIAVVPEAIVYHKESMTVGRRSPLRMFYMTRNRIILNKKHASAISRAAFLAYSIFLSLPWNVARLIVRREWSLLRALMRGYREGMRFAIDTVT